MAQLLLLCEYASLNGGEQSMLSTLEGVRAAGFAPAVAAPAAGPLADALRDRRVEVLPFETHDRSGRRRPQDALRRELARLIRQRRPDLLHANSLSMGRLSGPVAAELGLPSLAHLRDIIRLSRRAIGDLNCHTRLLAVSAATRDYHLNAGLAAAKTHVLPNGVDLQRFRPRAPSGYLHQEFGLPSAARLIGTIGQLALRKGQDVLAKAASLLGRQSGGELGDASDEVHYLLVGERYSDKDESRRFEADLRAAAAGAMAGRFHLLGYRRDVAELLGELTLLVHPARQEPLGRVLLEAAASGVAAIATDVGGTREIFPPESQSARLVPPGDAPALARAIAELTADAPERRRLAAAARRRAESAFDLRTATAGLVTHYQAVARR